MKASKKTVSSIKFKWTGSCQPSGSVTLPYKGNGLAVSGGKFSDTTPYAVGTSALVVQVAVNGKVSSKKTTGTYSFTALTMSGICTSKGKWSAKAKK